jgi:hypothetical protein
MEASPFDVIVSDMRMPGMDGAALLSLVREKYPQVVRIILSSQAELSTALRVVPVAHQFLSKPCDAQMLRVAIERACHLKALLHDDSIRSMVGGLGELPSLPRTYHALTLALADPNTSIQKVAAIVEFDVGIAAKILQLVNSAFFGIARSITNIQGAVGYLGVSTLRSLVLSVEVFRVFAPKGPIQGFLGGSPASCPPHLLPRCPPSCAESPCRYHHGCRNSPRRGKAHHGLEAYRPV